MEGNVDVVEVSRLNSVVQRRKAKEFRGCNVAEREVTDPEYVTPVKYSVFFRSVLYSADLSCLQILT